MNYTQIFSLVKRMIDARADHYEDENVTVVQFGQTLFPSNYKCFHAHFKKEHYVIFSGRETFDIVIKASPDSEFDILKELNNKGFRVPYPFQTAKERESGDTLLIEEYVDGKEIHQAKEDIAWIKAAQELGKIHCEYWGTDKEHESGRLTRKLADKNLYQYNAFYKRAKEILVNAPRTIQHADLYPTNILWRPSKEICFIDWTDYAIGPYVMDIARMTALFDSSTLMNYCPCPEKTVECYYAKISKKVSRAQFIKDLSAGQFMEYYFLLGGLPEGYTNPYVEELNKRMALAATHF